MKRIVTIVLLMLVLAAVPGVAHDPPLIQEVKCGFDKCLSVCSEESHIDFNVKINVKDGRVEIISDDSLIRDVSIIWSRPHRAIPGCYWINSNGYSYVIYSDGSKVGFNVEGGEYKYRDIVVEVSLVE